MQAARTVGAGRVEVVEVPDPEPAPHEAVVAVDAVGVCGTDAHLFSGSYARGVLPCVQGHEIAGTVLRAARAGPGVGMRIVVDPAVSCGTCHACRIGRGNACREMAVLGVHRDGGLCERIAVPAARLVPIGTLPAELAPLAEPTSIALRAVARAGVGAGEHVVVLGAGPIGLLATARSRELGAHVLAVDRVPWRVAAARAAGAVIAHVAGASYPDPDQAAELAELTDGQGPAAVIEATGAPACLAAAVELVAHAGRVVAVGISDAAVALPMSGLPYKELDLLGSRNGAGLLPDAVSFLGRHIGFAHRLLTHRLPLSAAADAFALAGRADGEIGKVVVTVADR